MVVGSANTTVLDGDIDIVVTSRLGLEVNHLEVGVLFVIVDSISLRWSDKCPIIIKHGGLTHLPGLRVLRNVAHGRGGVYGGG